MKNKIKLQYRTRSRTEIIERRNWQRKNNRTIEKLKLGKGHDKLKADMMNALLDKAMEEMKNAMNNKIQDVCPEDRQGQKILRTHSKTAKDQNLDAKIKGQNSIVDGNSFSINDLTDLEKEVADTGNEVTDETAIPTSDNNIKKDQSKKRARVQYSPQSLATNGGRRNVRSRTQKNEAK
ncbi:hypothetical protein JTB14_032608 [Gonioctena quinquepunctata]|nr:hypothetical protein JTB14_032608 [Gonioctena quinquepunctata]